MDTSSLLLIASLGAIAVLLMMYVYIYMFERKRFLVLWFIGWFVIGLDYSIEGFFPHLLRQSQTIFFISLCTFFFANLVIIWGTLIFLETGIKPFHVLVTGTVWLILFAALSLLVLAPLYMIHFTYSSVFALFLLTGTIMIRSAKRYGRFIFVLGLLNIAWVVNNLVFSFALKMPQMAPYAVSQLILILNAIGLIQLYFRDQKDTIRKGMDHIAYLTYHDGLTGLYNKSYFDNKLQEMENRREFLPVSFIVGDMNGLKFINDVFGHHEGDRRLRKVAQIIQRYCRQGDIVARWGGDEFAVILPNTDRKTVENVLEKINADCNELKETDLPFGLSLGAATKTEGEGSLSMVLKAAEEQMYHVKLIDSRKSRGAMAETLGRVLAATDHEMKGHIERLRVLAKKFAAVLGISAEGLDVLLRAVSLHDIGKIGISNDIICKSTPPEVTEQDAMRRHAEIGYRIAQASGEFANLADVILYHHEWWNGEGYPQGIREEEIPFFSRMISIMEAFDAMTHRKQNGRVMTIKEAMRELDRMAGIQFDPALVRVFVRMMCEDPDFAELSRDV